MYLMFRSGEDWRAVKLDIPEYCPPKTEAAPEIDLTSVPSLWQPVIEAPILAPAVSQRPASKFTPSKYQQAFFDFISKGEGSAVVEAVAGSGKTTTIVQALSLIPATKRTIFMAFNRNIADELKSRVPTNVQASTFHSIGFKSWMRRYPRCKVDEQKVIKIIREQLSEAENGQYGMFVSQLVNLAKQRGILALIPDTTEEWSSIIEHFDLHLDGVEEDYEIIEAEAVGKARAILQESNNRSEQSVDFNDMIYMPILRHLAFDLYDFVFIDEAQDTNNIRRAMAKAMLTKTGRLVAVGDSRQAIYGFTGADSDSMDLIQRDMAASKFPLSISYRCSKAVVEVAKHFVPEIESTETAPSGIVQSTTFKTTPPRNTDAILCRNTAPLVQLAYSFIGNGTACKILGRDIGRNLQKFVDTMKANSIDELSEKLNQYAGEETARLMKQDKAARAQSVSDKVDCLDIIISHLDPANRTIAALMSYIDQLFGDNVKDMLTLSTVHKSKGLEWTRVYIYQPELMPSKHATQPWQQAQETNLIYVATTRAREELYYVKENK